MHLSFAYRAVGRSGRVASQEEPSTGPRMCAVRDQGNNNADMGPCRASLLPKTFDSIRPGFHDTKHSIFRALNFCKRAIHMVWLALERKPPDLAETYKVQPISSFRKAAAALREN